MDYENGLFDLPEVEVKIVPVPMPLPPPETRVTEVWIRGVGLGACIIALVLLLNDSYHLTPGVIIKWNSYIPFKLLTCVSGACAAYQLFLGSVSMLCFFFHKHMSKISASLVYYADQVFAYLLLACAAAATHMYYLILNGYEYGTYIDQSWGPVCPSLGNFCDKIRSSIILSFVGVIMLAISAAFSAHKLYV